MHTPKIATLGKKLGSGGFGEVYLCSVGDKEYACKFLTNSDLKWVRRFKRETSSQKQLDHPNIMPIIFSADEISITNPPHPSYFIMPLAAGTLAEEIQSGSMTTEEQKKVIFDILSGLDYLHSKSLAHRDLKPANILKMIDDNGNARYVISDFGLVSSNNDDTTTLTQSGYGGGSVPYAAPECINSFHKASAPADIYSVGAILHDIFGKDARRIPYAELHLSGPLDKIISKCTKTQPNRRYSSIPKLREDLFNILEDPHSIPTLMEGNKNGLSLLTLLEEERDLKGEEWDHLFDFIDANQEEKQLVEPIFYKLSLSRLEELHQEDEDLFIAFGKIYAEFMDQYFPFEYCDIILDKAKIFIQKGDLALKAIILVALLKLGTSHRRWRLEHYVCQMMGESCPIDLAERIMHEIKISEIDFPEQLRLLSDHVGATSQQFHPLIRELLND